MSDKKLYQLTPLAAGASDLVYIARADGSADGSSSFTGLSSVLGGVLAGSFQPLSTNLTSYADVAPSANVLSLLGCANYAAMRTALGLVVGTNVQAYNANLTTFAAIAPSANVQTLLGAADFAAFRTSLGLVIGTNVQAYSANLTTYAGIAPSANVQSLLGCADYSAMRTALGLVIGTNVQAYNANLTTFAAIAPSANVQTLLGAASFSAFRTSLSLVPGTDVQAFDADLSALAALSGTNTIYYRSAANTWSAVTVSTGLDFTAGVLTATGGGGATTNPQGRLSLTSGVAVMIADATAQGTVYYVPYLGKYLPIYSGSTWSMLSFGTGVSLTLNSTDNLLNNLYDIWCYSNAGTATLGTGPAWTNTATITVTIATPAVVSWTAHGLPEGAPVVFTNAGGALPTGITAGTTYFVTASPAANTFNISTTLANAAAGTKVATSGSQSGTHTGTNSTTVRGTGAGTTELELKDGIWTNKNAITLRAAGSSLGSQAANTCTYLGTAYMTANGQTGMMFRPAGAGGGSANILGLYNAYNRVRVGSLERDTTSSWNYATATWRASNGNVNNRITWVDGLAQSPVDARTEQTTQTTVTSAMVFGIALNSTDQAPATDVQAGNAANQALITVTANENFFPGLGVRYAQAMEIDLAGTSTIYGLQASGRQNYSLRVFLDL